MKKQLLAILLILCLALTLMPFGAAAVENAVPGLSSEINYNNAMAILKAYDTDGYYLVSYLTEEQNLVELYLGGSSSNADGLDTVVHEFYHGYSFQKPTGWNTEAIYLGGQKDILVDQNSDVSIFPTETWAETLPQNLRTFRFDTYVAKGSDPTANLDGPYGLLNEFTAYCWGMHNQLALFAYYKSQGNSMDVWSAFLSNCSNDRQAYAEFRFWTLGYLDYAKSHNPAVYEHFMNNENYLKAYLTIKGMFESQIGAFDDRCNDIIALAAADGVSAYFEDEYFVIGYQGIGLNVKEYQTLMQELSKSKYQDIENAMRARVGNIDDSGQASDPGNPFRDVKKGAYYFDAVLWALNHDPQITDGVSATSFAPDKTCTRGQVVTFLWRANGCKEPSSTKNPFKDVKPSDYFYKAVLWAVEQGITDGTSATAFSPNAACTRAHVVTFLWRAENKPDATGKSPFKDVASGAYYHQPVLWAVSNGITDGVSANTFAPDKPCTRGQIVTFLYRDKG